MIGNSQIIKGSLQRNLYLADLRELQSKIKQVNAFNSELKSINGKLNTSVTTVKELQDYLKSETGIANLVMASDALNLKEDYLRILELSAPAIDSELITIDKNGQVEQSEEAIAILQERHTPEVCEENQEYARLLLTFKQEYDKLPYKAKLAFKQFGGTEVKVNVDAFLYPL